MFDPITGALIAAGGSFITGMLNNSAASSRQEDAQNFSAEQYANRYQTTVKDMRAAGLNPMLAYSQGAGNAPTSAAASSAGMPDIGSSFTQGGLASAQRAQMQAQTKVSEETAEGIALDNSIKKQFGVERAQAELSNLYSLTGVNLETQGKLAVESEKAVQEILNLKEINKQVQALVVNLQEQNKLLKAQGITENVRAGLLAAEARKVVAETKLVGFDVDAAVKSGNFRRVVQEYEPASRIATDWLSKITDLLPSKHISTVIKKWSK